MKKKLYAGTTSHIERVFLQDTSQTDGRGLTGLAYNSAGLTVYYIRQGEASATAISLVTATVGTWVSGGFVEIDATNMPGWYELHVPNAALAAGAKSVGLHLKGATDMAPYPIELELDAVNYQSAADFGVTALIGHTPQTGDGYARLGANGAGLTAVVAASVTGNVGGNVTGSVGSLATQAKADVNAEVDTALADYDPPTRTEATSDKAEILAAIPTPPTASAIADQVWDETLSGHLTASSTGAALNAANAPTAAAVADAVWDEALSGHTTDGTAGKALSDAATGGTVTISYSQVALALAAAVSAGTITLRRGDRISLQITGLGALPAGRDKLWFTVKSAPVSQADSASIIQVTETGGLLYLNGAVPSDNGLTSADGSLTVDDATDGDVTLVLSAAASALLVQKQSLTYDLQYQDGSTVTTLAQGVANVVADVTRAVS